MTFSTWSTRTLGTSTIRSTYLKGRVCWSKCVSCLISENTWTYCSLVHVAPSTATTNLRLLCVCVCHFHFTGKSLCLELLFLIFHLAIACLWEVPILWCSARLHGMNFSGCSSFSQLQAKSLEEPRRMEPGSIVHSNVFLSTRWTTQKLERLAAEMKHAFEQRQVLRRLFSVQ